MTGPAQIARGTVFDWTYDLIICASPSVPEQVRAHLEHETKLLEDSLGEAALEEDIVGDNDDRRVEFVFLRVPQSQLDAIAELMERVTTYVKEYNIQTDPNGTKLTAAMESFDEVKLIFRDEIVTKDELLEIQDRQRGRFSRGGQRQRNSRSASPRKVAIAEPRYSERRDKKLYDIPGLLAQVKMANRQEEIDELEVAFGKLNLTKSSSLARARSAFVALTRTAVARAVLN